MMLKKVLTLKYWTSSWSLGLNNCSYYQHEYFQSDFSS